MKVITFRSIDPHRAPEAAEVMECPYGTIVEVHTRNGALRLNVDYDGYFRIDRAQTLLEDHNHRGIEGNIASGYPHDPDFKSDLARDLYRRLSNLVKRKNAPSSHEDLQAAVDLARQAAGIVAPEVDNALTSVREQALKEAGKKRKRRKKARTAPAATIEEAVNALQSLNVRVDAWASAIDATDAATPPSDHISSPELPPEDLDLILERGSAFTWRNRPAGGGLCAGCIREIESEGSTFRAVITSGRINEASVPRAIADDFGNLVLAYATPVDDWAAHLGYSADGREHPSEEWSEDPWEADDWVVPFAD